MKNKVKTVVIGPESFVNRVIEEGGNYPDLSLISRSYKSLEDVETIVENVNQEEIDVILFTGPIPFMIAQGKVDLVRSLSLYIEYAGSSLYRVLFKLFLQDKAVDINNHYKISIDFLNEAEVYEAIEELDMERGHFEVFTIKKDYTTDEIVSFHEKLWKSGQIQGVVTCLFSVRDRLKELGIPSYCIMPTRAAIKSALNKAMQIGEHKSFQNNQIAACLVYGESPDELSNKIKSISDTLQTSAQKISENIYLLYTTKGFIFALTEGYKKLPDMMMTKTRSRIIIGIGMGTTAKEAQQRAHSAYLKSKSEDNKSLYIVGDDNFVRRVSNQEYIGTYQYNSRSYDESIRKIAEETGLSVSTLSKIIYISKTIGRNVMTSADLSEQLNITLRSARRIVKALLDHRYIEVVGEEQPLLRGRPRKIYRLMIS